MAGKLHFGCGRGRRRRDHWMLPLRSLTGCERRCGRGGERCVLAVRVRDSCCCLFHVVDERCAVRLWWRLDAAVRCAVLLSVCVGQRNSGHQRDEHANQQADPIQTSMANTMGCTDECDNTHSGQASDDRTLELRKQDAKTPQQISRTQLTGHTHASIRAG